MSISQIMKMWIVHATVSFLRANLIINPERSDLFVAQQISEEGASGSSSSSSSNGISSSNRSGESSSETSMAVPTVSVPDFAGFFFIILNRFATIRKYQEYWKNQEMSGNF